MKLVYIKDGKLAVVHAAAKHKIEEVLGGMSDEEYFKHVIDKSVPEDVEYVLEISEEDVPENREFREAWDIIDGKIEHDMEKAREMHLGKLREKRADVLPKLDVEYMRALEQNNSAKLADIAAKRQALRDMPKTIKETLDACKSVEELSGIVPASLRDV